MKQKRGMTQNLLVILILALVIAFILGLVVMGFVKIIDKGGTLENCRISILAASQSKKIPTPTGTGGPFNNQECPRREFILYKKDIVEKGIINQDKAHKRIADAMAECWYMVGEGKLDPFSNWDTQGKNYCLLCTKILFDKKLDKFIASHSDELDISYLMTEKGLSEEEATILLKENIKKYLPTTIHSYLMTHKRKNTQKTYYEYLYNEEPPTVSSAEMEEIEFTPFLPGSTILVNMYKYDTKSSTLKWVGYIGAGVLIVAGVILAPFTGGSSLLVSVAGLSTITASVITAVAIVAGVGAGYTSAVYAFSDCPDCEGIGKIDIYPPNIDFSSKNKVCVQDCNTDDPTYEEIPICSVIVN